MSEPLYDHNKVAPIVNLIEHTICNSVDNLKLEEFNNTLIEKILKDFKDKNYISEYNFKLNETILALNISDQFGIHHKDTIDLKIGVRKKKIDDTLND